MLTNLLIVVFCLSAIAGGLFLILSREPSRSLFGLLLTSISVGVLFLLLAGVFVAMVQIIVYAGAVLMLFLFVVRYFGQPSRKRKLMWQNSLAVLAVVIILFQLAIPLLPLISEGVFELWGNPPDPGTIGSNLFTRYLYPFELTSVLLLVAIVGAIYMAREEESSDKEEEKE